MRNNRLVRYTSPPASGGKLREIKTSTWCAVGNGHWPANLITEIIMMHNKNIANAGWIIGGKVVQSLLGIVISMLTARYLGPSNFGLINYAAAIVAFIAPVATLGLSHVIVQEIVYSPETEGEILGSSIAMSFVSGVVCIFGVVFFSVITNPDDPEAVFVCGLYSLLLLSKSLELIQYWFQAKLISKYTAIVSVIAYVIISLYKAILLITKQGVYWFAVSNAIDHLVIGITLLAVYNRKCSQKLQFSFACARRLFAKSKYFIVSSMMVTIFAQTDKIMLRFMIDDAATGIYSAASSCVGMTSFVFAAIIDSMRPTIVAHKKKTSPFYEINICRLYSTIIYMALLQSLAMTLLASPIISILYGSAFSASASALRIVVWHTTFSYIGAVRNVWILAEGKQQYLWIINLCGALTNIVLNVFMIRIWGVDGAALASVITQMFTNFIVGLFIKPIRYNNWLILKSLHPRYLTDVAKSVLKR